jgi:UrcA family protein
MRSHATIAVLALLSAVQVNAQQPAQQVTVSYADLDLRSEPGVRTFDRRLKRAIEALCSEEAGSLSLRETTASRKCVRVKTAEVAEQRNRVIALKANRSALAR